MHRFAISVQCFVEERHYKLSPVFFILIDPQHGLKLEADCMGCLAYCLECCRDGLMREQSDNIFATVHQSQGVHLQLPSPQHAAFLLLQAPTVILFSSGGGA